MDPGRLVEVVLEDRPEPVALDHVDARAGPGAVEAECVDRRLLGVDLVLDLVDGQLEDLRRTVALRVAVRLVAGPIERSTLAVQKALDHGQGVRVMVAGSSARARCRGCVGAVVVRRGGGRGRCPGRGGAGGCRCRCVDPRGHGCGGRARRDGCGSKAATGDDRPAQEAPSVHVEDRRLLEERWDVLRSHGWMVAVGLPRTK